MTDAPPVDLDFSPHTETIHDQYKNAHDAFSTASAQLFEKVREQLEDQISKMPTEEARDEYATAAYKLFALENTGTNPQEIKTLRATYPEIAHMVDNNADQIDLIRETKANADRLLNQAIAELKPDYEQRAKFLVDHLDYYAVLGAKPYSIGQIMHLGDYFDINLHATEPYWLYNGLMRANEYLIKIEQEYLGTNFIKQEAHPQNIQPDTISKAKQVIIGVKETVEKMKVVQDLYDLIGTPQERRFGYSNTATYHATGWILDEEGLIPGFSQNPAALLALAQRIEEETIQEEVPKWLDQTPHTEASLQEARDLIDLTGRQIGRWMKLNGDYKSFGDPSWEGAPFLGLGGHYAHRGNELPQLFIDNPQLLLPTVKHLESQKGKLQELGILPRDYPFQTFDAEREDMSTPLEAHISGLETKDGLELVITEAEVLQFIRDYIPPYFFVGLTSISFEPSADLPSQETDPDTAAILKHLERTDIQGTIIHEIFEHTVKMLNVTEMEGWEKAIWEDIALGKAVTVSLYSRSSGINVADTHGRKEDFCDTAKMFVLKPAQLHLIAPARYNYFTNLFASHMPQEAGDRYITLQQDRAKDLVQKRQEEAEKALATSETSFFDLTEKILRSHEEIPEGDIKITDPAEQQKRWTTTGEYFFDRYAKPLRPQGKIHVYRNPYIKVK